MHTLMHKNIELQPGEIKMSATSGAKRAEQAEALNCAHCKKRAAKKNITCVCTQVVFCNNTCKENALRMQTHLCSGAIHINFQNRLKEMETMTTSSKSKEQFMRTVMSHLCSPDGPKSFNLAEWMKCAELPGPVGLACAYQVGCAYKHKVLGKLEVNPGFPIDFGGSEIGALESNALSFDYFKKAADGGHGLAMSSLADCYERGIGVLENHRLCQEWYWRAALVDAADAAHELTCRTVLDKELHAITNSLQNFLGANISPSTGGHIICPNLAGLLFMFHTELREMRFRLPSFAAVTPSCTVGNKCREGTVAAPLLFTAGLVRCIALKEKLLRTMDVRICSGYGRRGVASGATAMSLVRDTEMRRPLDSQRFIRPPSTTHYDFVMSKQERDFWVGLSTMAGLRFSIECIHSEKKKIDTRGVMSSVGCADCLRDAERRLEAVAQGRVILSQTEALEGRGHMAVIRESDGFVRSETFKHYSRSEVEIVLASLAALPEPLGVVFAHPLFIAQDPNLFWPLIYDHGCIRAALEHVAPHVDWVGKLGPLHPVADAAPFLPGIEPGAVLRRCGNESCLRFERDEKAKKGLLGEKKDTQFRKCGDCERRFYCSRECSALDWALHKDECKAIAAKGTRAKFPFPMHSKVGEGDSDSKSDKGNGLLKGPSCIAEKKEVEQQKEEEEDDDEDPGILLPIVGESVIIHGLTARPELNLCIGSVVAERTDAGRYPVVPVVVPTSSQQRGKAVSAASNRIAIKAENLHRVNVLVGTKKSSKSIVFSCAAHNSRCCTQCSLDFRIINHLSNLTASSTSSATLSSDVINSVTDTLLAVHTFSSDLNIRGDSNDGLSESAAKVLRDALLVRNPPLAVAALIVGMSSHKTTKNPSQRPILIDQLSTLLKIMETAGKT